MEPPRAPVDILEALLGSPRIRDFTDRGRLVLARKPKAERLGYVDFLLRILREVVRVAWRLPLQPPTTYLGSRLAEYHLAGIKAGPGVQVVNLDTLGGGQASGEVISRLRGVIADRLRESFSQGIGYLVLYGSADDLAEIKKLWGPRLVAKRSVQFSVPGYIEVSIAEDEAVIEAAALFYGVVDSGLDAADLAHAVVEAEARYYEVLEAAANDPIVSAINRQAIDDEEARQDSAFAHYALKALAIKHLLDSGVEESKIGVEETVAGMPVDIRVEAGWGEMRLVEAETLYGSGSPASRIARVIVERTRMGVETWIVVPPMEAFIYAPSMKHLLSRFRGRASFYTVDSEHGRLMPLEDYVARVERLAEKLARARPSATI